MNLSRVGNLSASTGYRFGLTYVKLQESQISEKQHAGNNEFTEYLSNHVRNQFDISVSKSNRNFYCLVRKSKYQSQ